MLRQGGSSSTATSSSKGVPASGLDLSSAFFVLNPDGDLRDTQHTFEAWLQQDLDLQVGRAGTGGGGVRRVVRACVVSLLPACWWGRSALLQGQHQPQQLGAACTCDTTPASWSGLQGTVGERPAARSLAADLQSHDLFLYFGHGSGEQYLQVARVGGRLRPGVVNSACARASQATASGLRLKQSWGLVPAAWLAGTSID